MWVCFCRGIIVGSSGGGGGGGGGCVLLATTAMMEAAAGEIFVVFKRTPLVGFVTPPPLLGRIKAHQRLPRLAKGCASSAPNP